MRPTIWRYRVIKGVNLTGIEADTGQIAPLFHPHRDVWGAHFVLRETLRVELTAVGRRLSACSI